MAFYIARFSHTYDLLRPLLFNDHPYKDKVDASQDKLLPRAPRSSSDENRMGLSAFVLFKDKIK